MSAGPSYTVLRIKRKATESPLASLVIQDQHSDPSYPSPTPGFGTPKRRRDVSYRPKGVFKLADTVPGSWIGRGAEGEVLQERIRGLMETRGRLTEADGEGEVDRRDKGKGKRKEVHGDDEEEEEELNGPSLTANVSGQTESQRPQTPATPPLQSKASSKLQYRVIPPSDSTTSASLRSSRRTRGAGGSGLPPPVLSYAEVEAKAKSPFRFIDAQAVSADQVSVSDPPAKPASPDMQDPQMAAFQDMLQEYLTLERSEASRKEAEEEYVYDLYYRDVRDTSVALEKGGGMGNATSIGALIGFDDFSPPSSPSSSEPEDEADEDSNDEDFYRNDYPEDEDADEDMEGYEDAFGSEDDSEQSGGSDVSGEDAGSDEDRGKWGYR